MQKLKHFVLSVFIALTLSLGCVAMIYLWLGSGAPQTVQAAPLGTTWYVNPAGDNGNDCLSSGTACETVPGAISKAADTDTIIVEAGVYTDLLFISKDLTIIGAGQDQTILDGNQAGRVLVSTGQLTLQDLTIRNGLAEDIFGGGIYNAEGATMTLESTLIFSNSTSSGGAIYNRGALYLQNSDVISNSAAGGSGSIYNYSSGLVTITNSLLAGNSGNEGGGLYNYFGDVLIVDSTIRHNYSVLSGGGIYAIGGTVVLSGTTIHHNETDGSGGGMVINQAVCTMTNTTISGNAAVARGGIYIQSTSQTRIVNSTISHNSGGTVGGIGNSSGGTIHLKNTIVANNDGYQCQTFGTWVSEGYNLSSDSQCDFTQTGDLQNIDPLLAPLTDYGGPTLTHAVLPGSQAIDGGDNTGCPPVDQRGIARPVDGNNSGTAVCDIGSYEARNQITISDTAVVEGDIGSTDAVITVTLAPTSTQPITVDYATSGGTAISGDDFNATSGTLTFAPGESTQFITVTINGDTDDESDEAFTVDLSSIHVDLVDSQAVVTIIDDDGLPALTIIDQTVDEGDSGSVNAVFEVMLSPSSSQVVTVNYTTMDGTAVSGSDYAAVSGTLTFTVGDTSELITVTVYGDLIDEGNSEAFTVELHDPTNANLADGQGAGTITDDDLAVVSMTSGPQMIEGDTGVTTDVFTVTLSTPTAFSVTVDYATRDGYESAVAGSDYVAISGTLTFIAGETSKLITVTVNGDTMVEPDEFFSVILSNADPINIRGTSANATIINDDFYIYLPLIMK